MKIARTFALVALLLAPVAARAETPVPADRLAALLSTIARGKDPVFGSAVAPALSADPGLAAAARAERAIQRISQEISHVAAAFASAAPGTEIAAARAAVARVSPETARDGASRSFEGGGPSVSILRQLMFVPTQNTGPDPATRVMDVISRFERSPKTDDTYYEYSDPRNLKAPVTELPGSETSWTTNSRPPMTPGTLYALKKCRHIFVLGWFCNTQLYQLRDLPGSPAVRLMLTFLRPLSAGADNPAFSGDKAENIVDGYTAVYVVVPSGGLVLVYNLGIQSRPDTASQQSRLNEGQKAEYRQLVQRLEASLGSRSCPIDGLRTSAGDFNPVAICYDPLDHEPGEPKGRSLECANHCGGASAIGDRGRRGAGGVPATRGRRLVRYLVG